MKKFCAVIKSAAYVGMDLLYYLWLLHFSHPLSLSLSLLVSVSQSQSLSLSVSVSQSLSLSL